LNEKYSEFWTNPGSAIVLAEKEKKAEKDKKAKNLQDDED
jgi:hypothetical protein